MTIRLMQLFDFTLEDLAYNRRGELSPRQSVRVTNDRRALKRLLTAIGFGIIGVIGGPLAVMGWLALATDSATEEQHVSPASSAPVAAATTLSAPMLLPNYTWGQYLHGAG